MPLLEVRDLSVSFASADGIVQAVRGLSFDVDQGKTLGIVGESGSGKSVATQSIVGLTEGAAISGEADFNGRNLLGMSSEQLRHVRGAEIALIFQDPLSSLHPLYRVGWQIVEAIRAHERIGKQEARQRAIELLRRVGIPQPESRVDEYPHQFSGGMRQRAMIAMALALNPKLLVADEPTTALDVTVQAQIVDLLKALQQRTHMAMLFVSHDLGLVSQVASRVLVMYAGEIVEEGPLPDVFLRPRMPYTRALMRSRAELGAARRKIEPIPGTVPKLARLPTGCTFHPRCPHSVPGLCDVKPPPLERAGDRWSVRCHRWREIEATET